MTIINPKSISGITSITTASGADNLLTVHTNNTTERIRINNDGDVIVGSGITVSPDGDIFATGVTTSTTFVGALTGNVTGNVSGSSGSATGNAGGLTGTPNISCGTIAGSTGTFSGAVSGTTGTFTGDVDIADKIVHTGDTNTAIRFPAADTITVETGGSERTRVDSSGNFMIGATSASGKFHVEDSGEVLAYIIGNTSSAGSRLVLQNKNTTANSKTGVLGADAGGQTTAQVLFYSADNDTNEGYLTLETRPASGVPTEAMRIDSSQRVLIGATSYGGGGTSPDLYISSTSGRQLKIHNTNSSTSSLQLTNAATGQGDDNGLQIAALSDGTAYFNQVESAPMRFDVNGSERMRIDNLGNLLVGRTNTVTINGNTSNATFESHINGSWPVAVHSSQTAKRGYAAYYAETGDGSGSGDFFARFENQTNAKFVIFGNGNVQNRNNSYGQISDETLKQDIVDAASQWDDIKNLRVRKFRFKDSPTGVLQIGVVAQEIEKVSAGLVDTDDEGIKSVKYSILYMKAVKALQEAITKIEVLETRLNNAGIAT